MSLGNCVPKSSNLLPASHKYEAVEHTSGCKLLYEFSYVSQKKYNLLNASGMGKLILNNFECTSGKNKVTQLESCESSLQNNRTDIQCC